MTDNNELDNVDFDIEAPDEGDGYFQDKTLQWADLCPHMGTSEKTLLRILTNLTTKRSRQRRLSPDELRQMIYTGPVAVGQAPKLISPSGLLRLLRNLAALGQITDRDGKTLSFSSRASARSRAVTMTVWRYPRHECGCQRNVFDALDLVRGQEPKWKTAGLDESALNRPVQAGQKNNPEPPAGQEVDPAGQEVDPAGQEVDPAGQEVDPDSGSDQRKPAPPSSPPSSSPSSSSSSHTPSNSAPPAPRGSSEDEDDVSSTKSRRTGASSASVALIQEMTDATIAEAQAVITRLQQERKRTTGEGVGVMRRYIAAFDPEDLVPHLDAVRAQRASEERARASQDAGPDTTCADHAGEPVPCPVCATLHPFMAQQALTRYGPVRRPDLAEITARSTRTPA